MSASEASVGSMQVIVSYFLHCSEDNMTEQNIFKSGFKQN